MSLDLSPSDDSGSEADPVTWAAELLAAVLADVMEVDEVPIDGHFFDDQGADSLTVAHFCARLRDHDELPSVSIKQVYQHPSSIELAAAIVETRPADRASQAPPAETPSRVESLVEIMVVPDQDRPVGTATYWLCGFLQFMTAIALIWLGGFVMSLGYDWVSAASGVLSHYWRSLILALVIFVEFTTVPILIKWIIVNRWSGRLRIWSPAYFAFWFARTLLRANPMRVFVGSPIYNWYLWLLGARIGRGAVIMSPVDPVCAHLLTIGDNAVIRKDSRLNCYRANAGWIETGPVVIGRDAVVGELTVLDIDSSVGDGAQLGHMSSLDPGQSLPNGGHWVGVSTHRLVDVDLAGIDSSAAAGRRRIVYPVLQLLLLFAVTLPVGTAIAMALAEWQITALGGGSLQVTSVVFYRDVLLLSLTVFVGLALLRFALATTVPRLLNRFIEPDRVYPLYGIHYAFHRLIQRLTNDKFLTRLFGDSSYILHYLFCVGYNVSFDEQTGAAFGQGIKHDNPYAVSVGPGTMVADDISLINADYTSTSFRIAPLSIGTHSFYGNFIGYPSGARTGDNCLHASKVMVPLDGEKRTGVGYLGSPSFEIPRSVYRDSELREPIDDRGRPRRLPAKNRHNLVSMGYFLLSRWVATAGAVALVLTATDLYQRFWWSIPAVMIVMIPFGTLYYALVERASTRFKPLQPTSCSIYDKASLEVERYWKVNLEFRAFTGTPLRPLVWRMLGVRMGRRVFDDGCTISERNLGEVGDHCTLNAGSVIQTHSLEDGAFKSDHATLGAHCTLGVGSLVHYGVTMGDGASLAANAFLMKGITAAPGTHWAENPAREIAGAARAERPRAVTDELEHTGGPIP